MKTRILTLGLVFLVAVVMWGCQEQGSTPVGPKDLGTEAVRAAKVNVCHIPPGNPANARIISVAQAAVAAHLAHGDALELCLIINEIMYDPPADLGSDSRGEYVELRNVGPDPIDLRSSLIGGPANSLKIKDNGTSAPDFFKSLDNTYPLTIPAGGFAVIYDNGSSGSAVPSVHAIPASAVQARVDDAAIGGGLNNGGDSVILLTADLSVVIDQVDYDGSLARNNGLSLQRCFQGFIEAAPTPGGG